MNKAKRRYLKWRLLHPFRHYRDYYAQVVADQLGTDKPPLWAAAPGVADPEMLLTLQRLGLTPDSVVVDYGCGALRFGRSVIDYLEPHRYFGMDIDARLYRRGVDAIPTSLVIEKNPRFAVINDASLASTAEFRPGFIASWQVLPVIPPSARRTYFRNMVRLTSPNSLIAADFFETETERRLSDMAWGTTRAEIAAAVRDVMPSAKVDFQDHETLSGAGRNHRNSLVIIGR